jgi:poly(3-hydroxyalkanoate) synthetase
MNDARSAVSQRAATRTALERRMSSAWLDTSRAATNGVLDYWSSAVRRRATPFQLGIEALEWMAISSRREMPRWSTPNTVVFETPIARLRDFTPPEHVDTAVVATLVLPPQAGHSSCIVDFSPDQSQLGAIRDAGLVRVFSMDWKGATQATKDASISDYLAVLETAVDHLGGRVNLIGDCQGGWLAVIYAALHPHQINTLTIAGAPIDYHCGEPLLHDWVKGLSPHGGMDFYHRVVAAGGGVLKGKYMLSGFKSLKPDQEVARQSQLLVNVRDPRHVARYRAFETWFQYTQDLPGAFYLWIVEHLFTNNELVRGALVIGGRRVDLGVIDAPLFLLGGAADHITPPEQVFALAEHASTPPEQVTRRSTTGGHLGLFMGREALTEHWPPLLAGVRALSVS